MPRVSTETSPTIDGLHFRMTCWACPEQYDVFKDGAQVGYVRLRYGGLTAEYPGCGGELIYETDVGGDWTGEFQSEEQRAEHLALIADALNERMEKDD